MRFLCLHGRGTNADIFERQLGPLISLLAQGKQFDFIDAPLEGQAAPGVAEFFEPPYFIWHESWTPDAVAHTHQYIRRVISEDGPYDGVIGFSEGAALAASLLLTDVANGTDTLAPLFRCAIFFNAVNVWSPIDGLGQQLDEHRLRAALETYDRRQFIVGKQLPSGSARALTEDTITLPISIPTLHVIGMKDRFSEVSKALVRLCTPTKRRVFNAPVGHEVLKGDMLDTIANEIEKMSLAVQTET